ncbi:16S rRNA (guanine(966)-N(2))-methyltransferase RsmD [Candidatus Phytoplasma sacchari]|uniref:16S rRNA (Guanine(966)-N(2))-methyltransferase RsmD n=1 Tax=Candidatus Phytoplasma sacchari TaxID=2609813 RepID=A0ABY7M4I1_9MOLU|nr:16S rRNA (guanine(966)-N(2))-methyltransferase RsmD [Candidatus Phytoplasma sacchari]
MIRIISGKYKGFKLKMVPSSKTKTSSHLIRKALFDTLGNFVHNTVLLDLFSGSGVYGFEALSRNAKKIYLVDHLFFSFKTIKENIKKLNLTNYEVRVFYSDAFKILKKFIKDKKKFDIIILDPPYFSNYHEKIFSYLDKVIHSNSLIIYETYHKTYLPLKISIFELIKTKKYGNKRLSYYNII